MNNNYGRGRGVAKEYRNTFEYNRLCLLNQMGAQYFKFVMNLEGTFKKFRQRRFMHSKYYKLNLYWIWQVKMST